MDEDMLAERLGVPVTVFDATPDTSAQLRQQARKGSPHGTFAVANELTAARGRAGKEWSAPPGGVWSSTLLYPALAPEQTGRLTIAGGLATVEMARSFGVDAWLKWPNDVVVDRPSSESTVTTLRRRPKLAGVLTEAVVDAVPVAGKPVDEVFDETGDLDCVVLGVGVNANFDPSAIEAAEAATTLRAEIGGPIDRFEVAARLHEGVIERAAQVETDDGFAAALDDYRELAVTLDDRVHVERRDSKDPLVGLAVDVDDRGALLVEKGDAIEAVTEGNCVRVRSNQTGANED